MNSISWKMFLMTLPLLSLLAPPAIRAESATNAAPEISITPVGQYVTVGGDSPKFRQEHWVNDGWSAGVEDASYYQTIGKDWTLKLEGRGIYREDDYKLGLELTKKDFGFVHAGFTQYREYSDPTGGFFRPFTPSSFDAGHDLRMKIGDIFFDVGLTLPGLPKLVLGYQRQYKDGDKSLLEWGSVTQGTETRKIFPSYKDIDETVDIFKVSLDHDVKNLHFADQFRYEWYRSETRRHDTSVNLNTSASQTVNIREEYQHDDFYNAFRMDSHLNEKVYWTLGYLFNTLNGEGNLNVSTPPPLGPFDKNWVTRAIDVDLESHVANFNTMFGPFAGLVINAGVQGEKTDTHGFTDAFLTEGVSPATANLLHSTETKKSLEEILGLRYTKIPFTTLYAEGRWTQQQIDLEEHETENGSATTGDAFTRDTDTDVYRQDYRVGFNSSPLRRLSFAGRYRRAMYRNDFNQETDTVAGYPAFLTGQDFTTDEVMGKLTLRPCARFSTSFTYQLVSTEIETTDEGVPLLAPQGSHTSGNYDSSIYSVSATLTPLSRLYLTGLFSFQDTRTVASDNQNPSVIAYRGNVYTTIGTVGYALDNKTDINVEYSYSRSDNFTDNSSDGLPLGIDNQRQGLIVGLQRKLTDHILAKLRYGYYEYNETSNGGIDNYVAHLVSGSCTLRF